MAAVVVHSEPAGHCVQLDCLADDVYSPAGHVIHVSTPAGLYLPAGQSAAAPSTFGHSWPETKQ